jgi:hypothetical protein
MNLRNKYRLRYPIFVGVVVGKLRQNSFNQKPFSKLYEPKNTKEAPLECQQINSST